MFGDTHNVAAYIRARDNISDLSLIESRVSTNESDIFNLQSSESDYETRISFLEDRDVQLFQGSTMVVSDVTVANTIVETELFSATIPADYITVPTMLELELDGVYSTINASDTFTVRIKINGTTSHSFVSVAKNVSDTPVELSGKTTIRTVGVSGTLVSKAVFAAYNDGLFGASVTTDSIDTTIANTISVTMQWDAASTGNTGTIKQGILKLNVNQG